MQKQLRRRQVNQQLEGVSPMLSRLYVGRGITNPKEANYSLKHLLPPADLLRMEDAANLVARAIEQDDHILILGDFDADGATSVAVLMKGLKAMGATQISYLVPNRFDFGYGLTPEIVEVAAEQSPDLIITVDNGISSVEGVAAARRLGIKTLITDHHLPGQVLPDAEVILNPNQRGCGFKSKNLAGVGVAFYLLLGLRQQLRAEGKFEKSQEPNLADLLDLVALGTMADVVPLDYNNRLLIQEGIKRIRAGRVRPGISALLGKDSLVNVRAMDLAFQVAPKLNAAGRLEDMSVGIECLLTDDESVAADLAMNLRSLNAERREIETEMKDQAVAAVSQMKFDHDDSKVGLCLYHETWHQGVVGIVASRIKDRFYRPVVAFAKVSDDEVKGSGRSIRGLHMRDAFDAIATRNPGMLNKFGGHAMAAGLSMHPDYLEAFATAFDEEARRWLDTDDLQDVVVSDGELAEIPTLPEIRPVLLDSPWGQGFPEPLFDSEFEILEQRIVGGSHLKMKLLLLSNGIQYDAIAFNVDRLQDNRYQRLAYRIDINEYLGLEKIQLVVEAFDLQVI